MTNPIEIGSFIELELPTGVEYYSEHEGAQRNVPATDIARLNSGRTAIYHALRVSGANRIWLPIYQCDTVREFLQRKQARIAYYHIDNSFNPTDATPTSEDAILLVNYYGVMSKERMKELATRFAHAKIIIDNSQAFFSEPLPQALNVYSCRKFFGVPDGAYVIGKKAANHTNEYPQCTSSDTSAFLLQRIEYGCEGKAYESRMQNEERIDTEDIMRMSALTQRLMQGSNTKANKTRRRQNFNTAHKLFANINKLDATCHYNNTCVPMVYPLLIEDDLVLDRLQAAKHFQGHWWSYLLDEVPANTTESWLSRYIIPITIDQRYNERHIEYLHNVITNTKGAF